MITERIRKNAFWILTGITGLFIIAIIFYVRLYYYTHQPEKITQTFNQQLNERYDTGKSLLDGLIKKNQNPDFAELSDVGSSLDQYYDLYVFSGNSIYYWSDNSINPDISFADSLINKRLYLSGNGLYQVNILKSGNFTYVLSDLIRAGYSYENEYLSPGFNPVYGISQEYNFSITPGKYNITDKGGAFLFSLNIPPQAGISSTGILLLYTFYLSALIALVLAVYVLYNRFLPIKKYPLLLLLFLLDIVFIRVILVYFRIPSSLYSAELFSPLNFAYSVFLPSLGDFFTDSLLSAIVFFLVYRKLNSYSFSFNRVGINRPLALILIAATGVFFFYFNCYLLNILINNSSFGLDLSDISGFSGFGFMAYFIIFFILTAYFFISYTSFRLIYTTVGLNALVGYFIIANLLVYLIAKVAGLYIPQPMLLSLQVLYFFMLILNYNGILHFPKLISVSMLVLALTMVSSYSLHVNKREKEKNERKLLALRLSSDRDKMGEFLYVDIENNFAKDTILKRLYMEAWTNPLQETACIDYIKSSYFAGYWTRYSIQITLCYPEKTLQIRPSNYIIGCHEYFSDIIDRLGETTASPSMYFIRESYDASSYIANVKVDTPGKIQDKSYIVIELSPKYVPKGLGYPELLMDKTSSSRADISDYSYAIFFKDELVKNVGDYNYGLYESNDNRLEGDFTFFDRNGYNHLFHIINKETTLIISKRNEGFLDKLSPFTYQLIFHLILVLIFLGFYSIRYIGQNRHLDFKTRLQLMVIALVLFVSLSVGITTIINISNLNDKKNRDMLSEKAHSVLIELEHKLATLDILDKSQKSYLEELLTKFSLVFFSDINLYDINGLLLASSRPQIFDEGLKSELMSAGPYIELARNKRTLFIEDEKIGNYKYLSAYLPFRNEQNKLTAYINLPYFAREQELRQEISTFLVAFINIYVLLTALAVFISLLAGNYLMQPLQLIRNRFSSLKLGLANEKIIYSRKDELGDLINDYNLMLDKLAESAEKLARSERESAWREMARQVAHEIKNPLTPMKLSIQHLHKSWYDNPPDWESRLEKTTHTLIEQIDSLASIASAFSDFAKLPAPSNKKTELTAIIRNTLALFNQHPEINFSFTLPDRNCYVFADEKQLSRAFINLFNNAVQAIPAIQKGQVSVSLSTDGKRHRIEIKDNGTGIDEEKKQKIFSPNFTTKSGGMGLGLAMVKNIIDSIGGEISFTSEKSAGTTFIIEIPAIDE